MPPTAWPGYETAQAKPHLLRVVIFPRMTSSRRLMHFSCAPTSLSITIGRTPSNHSLEEDKEHNFLKIMAAMIGAEGNKYWQ